MALNTNTTDTGGLTSATAVYYDKLLLSRLEKKTFFAGQGQKKTLPKNAGKTISFNRYTNGAAVTSELTDGTVPSGQTLASTAVTATPLQYGGYWALSDRLEMEAIDPIIESVVELSSYQERLSIDTIIRNALATNVTNRFGGGAVNELAVATVASAAELRFCTKVLDTADCITFDDDTYHGIFHPVSIYDLTSDNATGGFIDVSKYSEEGRKTILRNEVGTLANIRIMKSSNIATGTGASSATSYHNFIFSKEAFGEVALGNGNSQAIVKQLGSGGSSDPLNQIATVGWKVLFVPKVLQAARAIELIVTSNG